MTNIIIGWDMQGVGDQADAFKTGLAQVFVSASGKAEGYETDAEHIYFVSSKDRVDVLVAQGHCDILVCAEELGGLSIGVGSLKQWKKIGLVKKVILIVGDERYGKGKLKGLYDNGFYDILFERDFTGINLIKLALSGRKQAEAFDYYGLKGYIDPLASKKGKDAVEEKPLEVELKDKPKKKEKSEKKVEEGDKTKGKEPEDSKEKSEGVYITEDFGSEEDIIDQQHRINESMQAEEFDSSKGIVGFLKDGVDVGEFLNAMDLTASATVEDEWEFGDKEKVLEDILFHYTQEESAMMSSLERGYINRDQWDAELTLRIQSYNIIPSLQKEVFYEFNRFMFGYDNLEKFIMDPDVTDIKMLAYNAVVIKKKGRRLPVSKVFRSPEHFRAYVEHLCKRNHVNLQQKSAVTFMDTRSFKEARLRVNVATEFVNLSGVPSMEIRKQNNKKYTTQELIDAGMMTKETAAYCIWQIQRDGGVVVCGGNAQGKTSFTNWLIEYIPRDMTGLGLQEEDELFAPHHKYLKFQRIIKDDDDIVNDGDETETYDLRKLMAKGLKTDNDYFIISEITGEEAKFFVNATNTGSRVLTTVHAMDTSAALPKIADYATYDSDYTNKDFLRMMRGIKVIVYIEDFQIKEIAEVGEWNEELGDYTYNKLNITIPKKPKKNKRKTA